MAIENYKKDRSIEDGFRIKGTNKVFSNFIKDPTELCASPCEDSFSELISKFRELEDNLEIAFIPDLNQMRIEYISDEVIVCKCHQQSQTINFLIHKEKNDNDISIPFKTLSSLLTVPASYSKRSPSELNKINFEYNKDSDKTCPVKIVYDKVPYEFQYKDEFGDHTIQVYKVDAIIKAKEDEIDKKMEIHNEVPLLHLILSNIEEAIRDIYPSMDFIVQSYILGYNGFNKGRHFIRLLLNTEDLSIYVDGETYQYGLDIHTDFSGRAKDFGTVYVSPIFYRTTSETAFCVPFLKEEILQVMDQYVEFRLKQDRIGTNKEDYDKKFNNYIHEFSVRFDERNMYFQSKDINSDLIETGFFNFINSWFKLKEDIKVRIEKLQAHLESNIGSNDLFIQDILITVKKLDIKAYEAIKYFILEYVAGDISEDQVFEKYIDIVHFLSMLSLAYSSDIQKNLTDNMFTFVEVLLGGTEYSVYDKYKKQLSGSFLSEYNAE
jgi:hypothetical protein